MVLLLLLPTRACAPVVGLKAVLKQRSISTAAPAAAGPVAVPAGGMHPAAAAAARLEQQGARRGRISEGAAVVGAAAAGAKEKAAGNEGGKGGLARLGTASGAGSRSFPRCRLPAHRKLQPLRLPPLVPPT